MNVNFYNWIVENLGEWWTDYPYAFAAFEIIIVIIALQMLQNMWYKIIEFVTGR